MDSIIEHVAWPLSILVIILIFQRPLRSILDRIVNAKIPGGGEITFGTTAIDRPLGSGKHLEKDNRASAVDWSKVGNIFWLGHDLMWTIDALLRGAPKDRILRGANQSLHHAKELGFGGAGISIRIEALRNQIAALSNDARGCPAYC